MPTFILETYLAAGAEGEPDRTIARAAAAAAELGAGGDAIRLLRAIFIAEDETCLLLFEAGSAAVVSAAAGRAGLNPDRIAVADSRDGVAAP